MTPWTPERNRPARCDFRLVTRHDWNVGRILEPYGLGEIAPEVLVHGDHRSGDAIPEGRECDLLPLRELVVYMGKGPSVLQTLDVPRYPEMAQYAFDRLGWDGEKFDVYRCRVAYPVMPSSVVVRFDLLEKP